WVTTLFMVLSPLTETRGSLGIALERKEGSEREEHDAEPDPDVRIAGRADINDELRRDDAEGADQREHPAERGHRAAPVARPARMRVEDGDAGRHRHDAGEIDHRLARQEGLRRLVIGRVVD